MATRLGDLDASWMDGSWMRGMPVFEKWDAPRDQVYLTREGLHAHPFRVAQLAANGDPAEWLRRIEDVIRRRVDMLAVRACHKIDLAANVAHFMAERNLSITELADLNEGIDRDILTP